MDIASIIKVVLSKLPKYLQERLKSVVYAFQIKNGYFISPEPESNILDKFLTDGDWVLDVGSNIGHYTKRFSDLVGERGRVVVFEPVPDSFYHCVTNARLFKNRNVSFINVALSNKFDLIGMNIPEYGNGTLNYFRAGVAKYTEGAVVKAIAMPLDAVVFPKKIRLIKIDAEGHEQFIMTGMMNSVKKDMPLLIIETVTDSIRDYLIKLGYEERCLERSPNTLFVYGEVDLRIFSSINE